MCIVCELLNLGYNISYTAYAVLGSNKLFTLSNYSSGFQIGGLCVVCGCSSTMHKHDTGISFRGVFPPAMLFY